LAALPVQLWEQLYDQVIGQINHHREKEPAARPSPAQPRWQQLHQEFSQMVVADAWTLEELMRKSQENKEARCLVAGKLMMLAKLTLVRPLSALVVRFVPFCGSA
jgi:hypothetical protein